MFFHFFKKYLSFAQRLDFVAGMCYNSYINTRGSHI